MNQQREIIYEYRDRILEGEDMSDVARTQIADAIERIVREYTEGDYQEDWELEALFTQLEQIYPVSYELDDVNEGADREALVEDLRKDVVDAYDEREDDLGDELMRALERFMLLQIIDGAGASIFTTWTTCARASTCAGSPRSTRSLPIRTRASRCSRRS